MPRETVIEAVYEGGVFRPLGRVDLPEGKRVRVIVEESLVDVARRVGERVRRDAEGDPLRTLLAIRGKRYEDKVQQGGGRAPD